MIKILFHIDTLVGGGAEKVLCNLVNHMDQSVFDITVQTVYPDDATKYLVDGIKNKSIYPSKNKFYQMVYRVETALGLTYPLHMKDDYDIEIAYLEFGPTKVIADSTNNKAKKIAWVHCDFEIAIQDKEAFVKKNAAQYKKFDKVVCVSEKCKESFVSMFGDVPETVIVHNVIDDKEILGKAALPLLDGIDRKRFTFCTVGRFSPQKNYKRLLSAANKLHEEGFIFDLWILGDGEQRPMIEEYIVGNNMKSYVSLFGFQSNPYPFMREADSLACSSNYEGYSTFVAEGLILGKPIITTDCSGMHELLGDSEYGMIVPNDDLSFFEGMKRVLLFNKNQLQYYAEKSEERGLLFSSRNLAKQAESFFENLLK